MYAPDTEKHMNDAAFWSNLAKVRQGEINELREGLRDQFAMAAMQGQISNPFLMKALYEDRTTKLPMKDFIAEMSFHYADAMLKAREGE